MNFERIVRLFSTLPVATVFGLLAWGALGYLNGNLSVKQTLTYVGFVVLSVVITEGYRAFVRRFNKKEA